MKKIILAAAMTVMATTAQAEIAYDYNNPAHKADNTCVGVFSLVRDALFNEVIVKDGMAYVKIVDPTADLVKFRNNITAIQNQYILKYAPEDAIMSKQFNNHYKVAKLLIKLRTQEQGAEYLAKEIEKCMSGPS